MWKEKRILVWGGASRICLDDKFYSLSDVLRVCCVVQSFAEIWQGIEIHRPELLLSQVKNILNKYSLLAPITG